MCGACATLPFCSLSGRSSPQICLSYLFCIDMWTWRACSGVEMKVASLFSAPIIRGFSYGRGGCPRVRRLLCLVPNVPRIRMPVRFPLLLHICTRVGHGLQNLVPRDVVVKSIVLVLCTHLLPLGQTPSDFRRVRFPRWPEAPKIFSVLWYDPLVCKAIPGLTRLKHV